MAGRGISLRQDLENEVADAQSRGIDIEDLIKFARVEAEHLQISHHNDFSSKHPEAKKVASMARFELHECHRRLAMLEVLAWDAEMKALDETRRTAQEAAEKARECMIAQRAREKEQLEATRRALAGARMDRKRHLEDLH